MRIPVLLLVIATACTGSDSEVPAPTCQLAADPLALASADIRGRTLTLQVEYTGGCEDHAFEAWWGGSVAPSVPPVVPLEIQHDANGDTCRVNVQDVVVIDLSALDALPDDQMRISLLMGDGGAVTLGTIDYVAPDDTVTPAPEAMPIDTSCGTVR